jgi:hypothetical protein
MDTVLEIFQNCDAQGKNNLKFSSMNKLQYSMPFCAHNGKTKLGSEQSVFCNVRIIHVT